MDWTSIARTWWPTRGDEPPLHRRQEREHLTLLHYDSDFDFVVAITGQSMRWVVPRGTVP